MTIQNTTDFGMQAAKYWAFLFFAKDDVKQEILLAAIEAPPQLDRKAFNRALNRRLYHLARDLGFRKRHTFLEGRDYNGNFWERRAISFDEYRGEI
jgi:hypothetical protein